MVQAIELKNSPVGQLESTDEGQWAFVPDALPRSITLSPSLVAQLDKASLVVGTLAGVGETLENPHLLITPFLRREAVLSSKIEGTQVSISDVFIFEASEGRHDSADTREVINYISALERGRDLLQELPLCVRLTNEIHALLLQGVRGEDKTPGELRQRQNWIGSRGTPIQEARFIPPPARRVRDLLSDWERFIHEDLDIPALVRCAMMHYQFEAIHPYVDGNGRIGPLLIILFLIENEVLPKPLLYLSAYFERNRDEYIDHLYRVSLTGDWEPWLRFFLIGVVQQGRDALTRSRKVRELHEQYRERLQKQRASGNMLGLLDDLFANPYMTVPRAARVLNLTHSGAQGIINRLENVGILEYFGGRWPRLYLASELLEIIESPVA